MDGQGEDEKRTLRIFLDRHGLAPETYYTTGGPVSLCVERSPGARHFGAFMEAANVIAAHCQTARWKSRHVCRL